jgi:type II secretory pathway pseudopilin PulG
MKIAGKKARRSNHRKERGYALVAVMGVVMFALILMTVAVPPIKMETQREREEEMLWRGHQVAKALEGYFRARGRFPNNLQELVDGVDVGVKKMRFLRPSAFCDPMTLCDRQEGTNWKLVHPGDALVRDLLDAYVAAQQRGTIPLPPPPPILVQIAQMGATRLPGEGGSGQEQEKDQDDDTPQNASGNNAAFSVGGFNSDQAPIVGVVSKKQAQMFRSYYGIEENDRALFFAGVPVIAGGIYYPSSFGGMAPGGIGPNIQNPANTVPGIPGGQPRASRGIQ